MKTALAILCALFALPLSAAPFSEIDCTHAEAPREPTKLTYKYDKEQLKSLSYKATVYGHGKNGRVSEVISQTPNVALRVGENWLAGSNRGEWGGELMLIPPKGDAQQILKGNIRDLYKTSNGIIVVSGLSHMMSSVGEVFLIKETGASVDYSILFGLDAAPEDEWMTETGEVFITTYYGTSIIRTDGTLQRVLCKGHEYSKHKDLNL
ncbi:hypothetical protein ACVW0Y_003679 [Pseudomonas sp. TE3786]